MRLLFAVLSVIWLMAATASAPHAQACTDDEVARVVDAAGASLRAFNTGNAPKLQAKLRQLKTKRGWSDGEFEERSIDVLHDARVEELDRQANEILTRIDTLGSSSTGKPDCARLGDIQAASVELLATMRAKSSYIIARADALIEDRPVQPPSGAAALPSPPKGPSRPAAPPAGKASPAAPPPAAKSTETASNWSTVTRNERPVVPPAPIPPGAEVADGYTIDEIREATRGFFGQLSTGLASVIEHAFKRSGRPTAYVLGQEGGGAFLAGLRYGDGTLYLRQGGSQPIYWHGPSIGYDVGAAGSRTIFLIYKARTADDLYRRFIGLDGSAYVVGGVGITFLTNGDVVMAPIRSGIGLRLGASIGYVRFTPRPTWNPF